MTLECGRNQQALKESVIDAGLCTGCGACVGLCPNQESWLDRIVTIHSCDLAEGRCYAYCPRTPLDMPALRQALSPNGGWLPEGGPVRAFYVTQAADEGVRLRSQHGGTVTALLLLALEKGIIDEAIVTTADESLLLDGKEVTDVVGLDIPPSQYHRLNVYTTNGTVPVPLDEAGVQMATGYPGTPSSEIIEALARSARPGQLYVEWSINETVAMEVAAAASLAQLRSLCVMKQNGVNVASDFLLHLVIAGTRGGGL